MKRVAPALILALAALAMLLWTWGSWGDVQVDYGGEVYAAWRLREGDVLYRDVAYFTGPLSPYVNALLLRVFGTGIWTLFAANMALIALDVALVWALVRRMADRFAATAACLVFLTLFAFARFEYLGNSNYVAPYAHEVVHATPLCFGALLCLARWRESAKARWLGAAGALAGLVFLTKAEYTLALGAASLFALVAARAKPREWGVFVLTALAAPILAWIALATALGASEALLGVLGAWRHMLDARITDLQFYKFVMGTDHPADNLVRLLGIATCELLILGICWLISQRWRSAGQLPWFVWVVLALVLFLGLPVQPMSWLEMARPWPLFAGAAAVSFGLRAWRERYALPANTVLGASFAIFATLMLAKMVLNARVQMYGFALALPATLLVCVLVLETIPRAISGLGGSFVQARGLGCAALLAFTLGHLRVMKAYQDQPTGRIGVGADALRCDDRGQVIARVLTELSAKLKPGESFVVLPEGIMLNYLVRKPSPVKYLNYMPPEVLMFGEDRMVGDLRAAAPAAVVLLHKPTAEYGSPWFGKDYGRAFASWIDERYTKSTLIGDEPLRAGSRFGARILWRKGLEPR